MGNGEVGARREGEEQVMAEEAAFEIFIPCRLMAFSAVDRMEELGRARRKEGESFLVSGCRGERERGKERPEYILEGGHKRPLQ